MLKTKKELKLLPLFLKILNYRHNFVYKAFVFRIKRFSHTDLARVAYVIRFKYNIRSFVRDNLKQKCNVNPLLGEMPQKVIYS